MGSFVYLTRLGSVGCMNHSLIELLACINELKNHHNVHNSGYLRQQNLVLMLDEESLQQVPFIVGSVPVRFATLSGMGQPNCSNSDFLSFFYILFDKCNDKRSNLET